MGLKLPLFLELILLNHLPFRITECITNLKDAGLKSEIEMVRVTVRWKMVWARSPSPGIHKVQVLLYCTSFPGENSSCVLHSQEKILLSQQGEQVDPPSRAIPVQIRPPAFNSLICCRFPIRVSIDIISK